MSLPPAVVYILNFRVTSVLIRNLTILLKRLKRIIVHYTYNFHGSDFARAHVWLIIIIILSTGIFEERSFVLCAAFWVDSYQTVTIKLIYACLLYTEEPNNCDYYLPPSYVSNLYIPRRETLRVNPEPRATV